MTIAIETQYATSSDAVPDSKKIKKWAKIAIAEIRDEAILTIRIVDTKESARLNRSWRGINKSTNVLSFPAGDNPVMPELLGDIILCTQVINKEAVAQGKQADAHWAHMIIHGILHLAGYDHEKKRDAKMMETIEIDKLASIKFPNHYE